MTLALLIMAVGGAWAQEQSETFATTASTVEGTHFIISNNGQTADSNGMSAKEGITVTSKNGENITKVVITCVKYAIMVNDNNTFISSGTKTMTYNGQESTTVTATGVNATTFTFTCNHIGGLQFNQFVVYFGPEVIELKPDETGKNWILAEMPANNIELQVEYEPTKVTMAASDKTKGTVEVGGESKVEWTADTWQGWKTRPKEYTVDDITMTSSQNASIYEYTYNTSGGKYLHSLTFFVNENEDNSTVTFSTTGDPFSRIEFTMIKDYTEDKYFNYKWHGNPTIMPKDNWTFSGKSAVWEGEATKSLTLKSCSTYVSKITFFKGAIPDGVTINTDGTFTVAKTATVKLTATPAEGYKFLYWEDDQTNTNPVREVTIESGMADKTYKAVFAEILYNVTFVEGTNLDEWSATPNTEVKKDAKVDIKYTGTKKVIGVKVEEKKAVAEGKTLAEATVGMLVGSDGKTYAAADKNNLPEGVTAVALVCYVSDGHGLALALADESEKMIWNTAKSTCSGKTPAVTGCTWKLATQDEWNNMINAAGGFSALRDGFSSVGGTNMLSGSNDRYWSSTTTGYDCAWSCTFSTGNWTDDYADDYTTDYVRACLAF